MVNKQIYGPPAMGWRFGVLLLFLTAMARGQQDIPPPYPPTMPAARVEIYKTAGNVDMRLWIFTPEGHSTKDQRPAAVFFFGGGWMGGNPSQFSKHCEYLAARGMVAIAADYRVGSRNGVRAYKCVEDAKSAVRWMRKHADSLGIDPDRIAAGGGSAGGHLAAATATLPMYNDSIDDPLVSAVPNALLLFNPALVLTTIPGDFEFTAAMITKLEERMGVELESISPYHHVKPGLPPTIIFHGTADTTVPYQIVKLFTEKMIASGNQCVLIGYHGAGHGFFNYGRNDNAPFIDTMNKLDAFLVSLGYLKGAPETVQDEP